MDRRRDGVSPNNRPKQFGIAIIRERHPMYPGVHAKSRANQPAFIMAQTGVAVTYAELEQRTNRLAHFLRSRGLKRLDHYAIFMENNDRYIESCGAGERAGIFPREI